jgi:hypothetical protein
MDPSKIFNDAVKTGKDKYNTSKNSKPSFQQYVSQNYQAARQMNVDHTSTMQTLGKDYTR